jgi:hypothetical protein
MWDSIVDVKNVQSIIPRNFCHADRKRKGVVRVFEQFVIIDRNGVKIKPRGINRQAKWPLIAYEMNLVPAPCQILAEGRSQYSTSSDRWITGDSDLQ